MNIVETDTLQGSFFSFGNGPMAQPKTLIKNKYTSFTLSFFYHIILVVCTLCQYLTITMITKNLSFPLRSIALHTHRLRTEPEDWRMTTSTVQMKTTYPLQSPPTFINSTEERCSSTKDSTTLIPISTDDWEKGSSLETTRSFYDIT